MTEQNTPPSFKVDMWNSSISEDEMIKTTTEYVSSSCADAENLYGDLRVIDLGEIYRLYMLWRRYLNRVQPFFALKASRDPAICHMLQQLGSGFNCESTEDVQLCLRMGCSPQAITYTKRYKPQDYLRFAKAKHVPLISFDTISELDDIKKHYPEAKLLLRISASEPSDTTDFHITLGAPMDKAGSLFEAAMERTLNVVGVSFHAEAPVKQPPLFLAALLRGIQRCRLVLDQGTEMGYEMFVVDIGGGMTKCGFESFAPQINAALARTIPAHCMVIAEPGQFFSRSSGGIAKKIIGERIETNSADDACLRSLYLNSSVYSTFLLLMADDDYLQAPVLIPTASNNEAMPRKSAELGDIEEYTVRELAGYPFDRIGRWKFSGNPKPGDWLFFSNVGGKLDMLKASIF